MRLGTVSIQHTGEGALLAVAEAPGVPLAAIGPDSWPAAGITLYDPRPPFYMLKLRRGMR